MRTLLLIAMLALVPLRAAAQTSWISSGVNSISVPVPLGSPCSPEVVWKTPTGAAIYHNVTVTSSQGTVTVPVRCKQVTVITPPPVVTPPVPPVITPPVPPVVVPPIVVPPVTPPSSSADADFAARCAGATLCQGLDTEAAIAAGIETANDGTRQGFPDATVKTSGAASLKFTLRKGVGVANIGGAYETAMGSFAAGQTMYVQYRARFSKEYIANNLSAWHSSIKFINLHGPSSTCQGTEMTTIAEVSTNGLGNRVVMYTDCGNGWQTDPATNALLSSCSGDCLLQQASSVTNAPNIGFNCHYQNQHAGDGNGEGCFWLQSEKWYTFYEVIKLGDISKPNSSVYAYVAEGGGPYKQFHRLDGVTRAGGDAAYTRARLETYMTELPKDGSAATVDAFVWYDELIVSGSPIAAPGN